MAAVGTPGGFGANEAHGGGFGVGEVWRQRSARGVRRALTRRTEEGSLALTRRMGGVGAIEAHGGGSLALLRRTGGEGSLALRSDTGGVQC